MLTERQEFGSIEILSDGQIQVREDTIIERDGVEVHRNYHRSVKEPDMDPLQLPAKIRLVADVIWDAETVRKYKDKKRERTTP